MAKPQTKATLEGAPSRVPTSAVVSAAVAVSVLATLDDLPQLALAVVGAVAYFVLQLPRFRGKWAGQKSAQAPTKGRPSPKAGEKKGDGSSRLTSRPEVRQSSSKPVTAPRFAATGLDSQTEELLSQIGPTVESERVVQDLAGTVKLLLAGVLPEAEVMGLASGGISRGMACGVAVPEVDIIVQIPPAALASRLSGRLGQSTLSDRQKLHKSALRACTEALVSEGGFKFRRSAFRGHEPKVTLLAPPSAGLPDGIPVDVSVNSAAPLHNAALLAECGQLDPRAKALILFVRRWAKDRGICHAAKGHLAPYAWSSLVIFFMQARADGAPLLPPLEGSQVSSGLSVARGAKEQLPPWRRRRVAAWQPPEGRDAELTVAALFAEFARFYAGAVDWRKEGVSVRLGRRAEPGLRTALHIVAHDDGGSDVAPTIEDPFEPTRNLGDTMTSWGIRRLREELVRAADMCGQGALLDALLEPWAPPLGPDGEPAKKEKEDAEEWTR